MFSRKKHANPEHEAERHEAKVSSIKNKSKNLCHECNEKCLIFYANYMKIDKSPERCSRAVIWLQLHLCN